MNQPGAGITAMSKCTSLKEDHIKGTTSVSINVRLEDQDEKVLGAGNNLILNNLTPEMLAKLKSILGVKNISEATPICVQVSVMAKQGEIDFWRMRHAEEEKELPPEQTKLEGAPTPPRDEAKETDLSELPRKPKGVAARKAVADQKREAKAVEDAAALLERKYIDKLKVMASDLKIEGPGDMKLKNLEKAIIEAGGTLPKLG